MEIPSPEEIEDMKVETLLKEVVDSLIASAGSFSKWVPYNQETIWIVASKLRSAGWFVYYDWDDGGHHLEVTKYKRHEY